MKRIDEDACPHMSSYLNALRPYPNPNHTSNSSCEQQPQQKLLAEAVIQELKSFVEQHKRMPKELKVRVEPVGQKEGDGASSGGDDDNKGADLGDPDDKPDEDINPTAAPENIYERKFAQRLRKHRKQPGFFTGDQLTKIIRMDPASHPQVEKAWTTLVTTHWGRWEEVNFQGNYEEAYQQNKLRSKEAFELLRDVDSVRTHIGQKSLNALAHRLGYRTQWWSNGKNNHWSHADLLHLCRSDLCDLVLKHIVKVYDEFVAEFGGREAYVGPLAPPDPASVERLRRLHASIYNCNKCLLLHTACCCTQQARASS